MLSKLFLFGIYYEVEDTAKDIQRADQGRSPRADRLGRQVEVSIYLAIPRRIVISRSSAGV